MVRTEICPCCKSALKNRPRAYCKPCAAKKALARYHRDKKLLPRPTAEERFFAKVNKTDGCWLWTGHKHRQGYGFFGLNKRNVLAHRVSYEWSVGPIPKGLVLDHLCREPSCVRPDHLEAVTQAENIRRGCSPFSKNYIGRGRWGHVVHGKGA